MQKVKSAPAVVPHPDIFRPWVRDCLTALNVSAASVSRDLGLGRNTIGDFLAKPGRSISMTTAHVLTCKLHEVARDQSVQLPQIGGAADE